MLLLILNILFAILSVILYLWVPEGYSQSFCTLVLGCYLVQNIGWLLLQGKKRRLRFELLFMISFLFVNFIYPVFYAETYPHWLFFIFDFNRHVINQATALAYMAYAFYLLGITDWPWQKREEPIHPTWEISVSHIRWLSIITCVALVLFVATGGYTALMNVYSGNGHLRDVGVFSYFNNIMSISLLLLAALVWRLQSNKRWIYLLGLLAIIGLLLSTGSRQLSISAIIILMVTYSLYVRRMHWWQVVICLAIGASALFGIMLLRTQGILSAEGSTSSYQQVSGLDVFSDLTINSINLYVLVDWGNTHALTWLHGILIDLTSPIPMLGTWLVDYFNEPLELMQGGDLPSYILLGKNAGWGTGTNMVGELYRSFGAVGTCAFMFGLGTCLKEAYYRANRSIYWYVFYMLMIGHTIIYPRAPFLYDPRTLIWGLLLLWLVHSAVTRYKALHSTTKKDYSTEKAGKLTRIVYCIPDLCNAGGMERVLIQKANYLVSLPKVSIRIVTTETVPEGKPLSHFPLDERIEVEELHINFHEDFRLPLLYKYYQHLKKQHRYRKALREILMREKADICVSLSGKEIEWLGELDVPCRKIAEMHFAKDYREQLFCQYHPGWMGRCIGRFLTHQLVENMQQVDQLVVLTKVDRQAWEKAGVKHVICIPNPSALEPSNKGKHNKKQLLAVGRLHPQKGFDLLLEAWSQLAPKHPDWILRIAGEGDSRKALEQQILDLGLSESVSMEGVSQDICADYQSSRLFVLPSRWEGLPLALIEAMSQGTCCVAFDCPQGPSELLQDGVTGRLVSNGDIPAMVQALSQQMDDAEGSAQMGEAAYQYAQEHFALEPIMTKWKELLLLPH